MQGNLAIMVWFISSSLLETQSANVMNRDSIIAYWSCVHGLLEVATLGSDSISFRHIGREPALQSS